MHSSRLIWIALSGFAFGCAKGEPIIPTVEQVQVQTREASLSNSMLWGMFEGSLDPSTGTVIFVPMRGSEFTANVLRFMQPPTSIKNLVTAKIEPGSNFSTGHVFITVALRHPFPGKTTYTGFDVRGVIVGNGSVHGLADPSIVCAGANDLRVLNADGYTRWFNPKEFTTYGTMFGFTKGTMGTPTTDWTAVLNGYKCYCDSLGKNDNAAAFFSNPVCPNPRGIYSVSNVNERTFELQFPMGSGGPDFNFQYAVLASWMLPYPSPPVNIPNDFPSSANCQEAYAISVSDYSDMYYIDPANKGGTMQVLVRVFDRQGIGSGDGVPGEVSSIYLETPDGPIANGYHYFDAATLAGCLKEQDNVSASWLLKVDTIDPTKSGKFPVVVGVESKDPSTYSSGVAVFVYPENAHLAAYRGGWVTVSDANPVNAKDVTPPWLNIRPCIVRVSGSYCYVAGAYENGLYIFDISDPSSPVWVNGVDTPGKVSGLAVSNGYAYASDDAGLQIIDVDPPELAHIVNYSVAAEGVVAVSGGYAYVAGSGSLTIVNVEPPESAYVLKTVNVSGWTSCLDVVNGYAYVGDSLGIEIVKVDPPESSSLVKSIEMPAFINDVAVSIGYAYAAISELSLQVVDVDPPESAQIIKSVDLLGSGNGVAVSNGYACVAAYPGLTIINVEPPDSAAIVKTVDTPGTADDVAVSGGFAYVADGDGGLQAIDVDPPDSASIVKTVPTLNASFGVAVLAGYACTAGDNGMHIVEVEPPDLASIAGAVEIPGRAYYAAMSNGYAYVTHAQGSVFQTKSYLDIIDIDPPGSASNAKSVLIPGGACNVVVSGEYAFVADRTNGLQIVAIDPPDAATIIKTMDTPCGAKAVALSNGYAYVVDGSKGLEIIDVDPPESASVIKTVSLAGNGAGIALWNGFAYVAEDASGLQIACVSPASSAHVVSSVDVPGDAVAVSSGYAYVADNTAGLHVVDVEPPESANLVKTIDTPGQAWDVIFSNGYAYIADGQCGLRIIQLF